MASGNVVGLIYDVVPPATSYATPDTRAGGSSPAEAEAVWDFDDSAIEYLDFLCYLSPAYSGGGLTIVLPWKATSATSGAVVWGAAIRANPDDAEDIDAAHTYDYNTVTDTCASASGETSYPTITFTSGADMDSLAAGETFILRIKRDATNGSDTMTGDAELMLPIIKET